MSYTKPQMLKLFTTEELMLAIMEREDKEKAFRILSTSFLGQMLESNENVEAFAIPEDWECELNRCSDTSGFECDYVDGPARILVVH